MHFKQGKISFGFPETIDKFTDSLSFKGTESRDIFVIFYSHGKIYGGQIINAPDFGPFQEILLSITVFFSLRLIIAVGNFNSNWDQASSRGLGQRLWIFLCMNRILHPFWMYPSQPFKASIKGRLCRTSHGHLWAFPPLYSPTLHGACGVHRSKKYIIKFLSI